MAHRLGWISVTLIFLLAASCDDDEQASAPEVCTFGDECSDCVVDDCREELCACVDSSACTTLKACFEGCTNEAGCETDCRYGHDQGISSVYLLWYCAQINCPSKCSTLATSPTKCMVCAMRECPTAVDSCYGDEACSDYTQCLAGCSTQECRTTCNDTHPQGAQLYQQLTDCAQNECSQDC